MLTKEQRAVYDRERKRKRREARNLERAAYASLSGMTKKEQIAARKARIAATEAACVTLLEIVRSWQARSELRCG
jgi:hypothetical protein